MDLERAENICTIFDFVAYAIDELIKGTKCSLSS